MGRIACVALVLWSLIGFALSACQEAAGDYYENEAHGNYPGPAPRTENRD